MELAQAQFHLRTLSIPEHPRHDQGRLHASAEDGLQQLFGALVRLVEGEGEDGFGFAIFVADAGMVSALTAFRRGDALVGQVV